MDVAISIQEHVVRLDIPVYDILSVDISQGASQLGYPKPNRIFGECLSRYVESQIAAAHQIDYQVPIASQAHGLQNGIGQGSLHVLNVLETVA